MKETRYQDAIGVVAPPIRQALLGVPLQRRDLVEEIRLRAGGPVVLVCADGIFLVNGCGQVITCQEDVPLVCSYECLEQTFRAVCGYSVHTHQREIVKGFITLKGGHRVGIAGTMVERDGVITSVKEISSLNIRVAKEWKETATQIPKEALWGGLLLVGPPGCGKTTMLRDVARIISGSVYAPGRKVTVLDERGELAAMWDGTPQNDIGINTDVLNGFSKVVGMEIALRSLSPQVIVCDEIGSREEANGLFHCVNAGAEIIASVHGKNQEELYAKPWVMELLRRGVFEHIVFLQVEANQRTVRVVKTKDWLYEMDGHDSDFPNPCSCGGKAKERV